MGSGSNRDWTLPQRVLVGAVVAAVRHWPEEHWRWWRRLLDVEPQAALLIGELALYLDAEPASDEGEKEEVGEQLVLDAA